MRQLSFMNSGNCVFQLDSSARVILRTTGLTATPDFVQALSAVITWSAETAAPALAAAVAVRPATLAPTVKFVSALFVWLHVPLNPSQSSISLIC